MLKQIKGTEGNGSTLQKFHLTMVPLIEIQLYAQHENRRRQREWKGSGQSQGKTHSKFSAVVVNATTRTFASSRKRGKDGGRGSQQTLSCEYK